MAHLPSLPVSLSISVLLSPSFSSFTDLYIGEELYQLTHLISVVFHLH